MDSIIQGDHYCWLCKKVGLNVYGTDRHHCIHGTGRRNLADEDGLTVYLCQPHHRALHDKGLYDLALQQEAQLAWMEYYNKTAEDWIARYGKNYL